LLVSYCWVDEDGNNIAKLIKDLMKITSVRYPRKWDYMGNRTSLLILNLIDCLILSEVEFNLNELAQGIITRKSGEDARVCRSLTTSAVIVQLSPTSALIGTIKSKANVPLISVQVVSTKEGVAPDSPKEYLISAYDGKLLPTIDKDVPGGPSGGQRDILGWRGGWGLVTVKSLDLAITSPPVASDSRATTDHFSPGRELGIRY
jgi:hypothetical protein